MAREIPPEHLGTILLESVAQSDGQQPVGLNKGHRQFCVELYNCPTQFTVT